MKREEDERLRWFFRVHSRRKEKKSTRKKGKREDANLLKKEKTRKACQGEEKKRKMKVPCLLVGTRETQGEVCSFLRVEEKKRRKDEKKKGSNFYGWLEREEERTRERKK